jgi:hypothetical protein
MPAPSIRWLLNKKTLTVQKMHLGGVHFLLLPHPALRSHPLPPAPLTFRERENSFSKGTAVPLSWEACGARRRGVRGEATLH